MKIFKLLSSVGIVLLLSSCAAHINDYHAGVIVDEAGKPIDSVLVYEDLAPEYLIKTYTNGAGYFKQKRQSLMDLIVSKKGYVTATIPLVWHQHGETTTYSSLITQDSSKIVLKADMVLQNATIILSFNSICCGPADGKEILNYIKKFSIDKDLKGIKITKVTGLGKEGEFDYFIEIAAITKNQKIEFIKNLQILIAKMPKSNNKGSIKITEDKSFEALYPSLIKSNFKEVKL